LRLPSGVIEKVAGRRTWVGGGSGFFALVAVWVGVVLVAVVVAPAAVVVAGLVAVLVVWAAEAVPAGVEGA
jgi:hypothetical protein